MTHPRGVAAGTYSAGSAPVSSVSPLDFGDKCFLCSSVINIDTPPVEPRGFYISPKTQKMALCHQRCIDDMEAAGGTPKDFHTARAQAGKPAVEPTPAQLDIKPPVVGQGAAWLHFEKGADYNDYVAKRGGIS